MEASQKRKVCFECLEDAEGSKSAMLQRLLSHQPVLDVALPVPREATVTLDDSDQVPIVLVYIYL
jgi:hypothetical protein